MTRRRRFATVAFRCLWVALASVSSAWAQYTFDPSADDEKVPGIRYFGSAKGPNGSLMPGVTFAFYAGASMYVFTTNEQGRFRGKLPLDTQPQQVVTKCHKTGFESVRITQRVGALGPQPTVQVDCVLQPKHAN